MPARILSDALRRHLWRGAVLSASVVAATAPRRTLAQAAGTLAAKSAGSANLNGVVVFNESGLALLYALVSIPALNLERFTNERGQFAFPALPDGTYRLRIRQLGYTLADVNVVLTGSIPTNLTVKLVRIIHRLSEMRVSADWVCDHPGRPTSAVGEQAVEVFEQLEQNADRMRVMSQQYPFEIRGERWEFQRQSDGSARDLRIDTAVLANGKHKAYRAGEMVYAVKEGAMQHMYYLQLPDLLDLADAGFQKAHCFLVRGIDDGEKHQLRIDFKASSKLKKADVEGSIFLDSATYQLQRSEMRLTSIPSEIKGVSAVRFTTTFREVRLGLPVLDAVHAETDLTEKRGEGSSRKFIEEQKALGLKFLKTRPDSIPN